MSNILLQFFLFFIIIKGYEFTNYYYIDEIMMLGSKAILSQLMYGLIYNILFKKGREKC